MRLKSFVVTAAFCSLLIASTVQAATTLRVLGRHPFYQPPLTSVDDLKKMIQTEEMNVKQGFSLTPHADLFPVFMDQIYGAEIKTVAFKKGSKFEWMFYKSKGKGATRVVKDLTWGGEKPFIGYKFYIDKDGARYDFAVPLACGNIALMGMSPIPAAPPVTTQTAPPVVEKPKPAPNQPPRCGMVANPVRAFCGEMIAIDASSSSDSDGNIENMSVVIVDDQGQVVSEKVVTGSALQTEIAMPCGSNTLKVTVTDNDGEDGTSSECTAGVTGIRRVGFLADAGYYHQFDPGHYLFGRVGFEYKLNQDWSLLGLVGGAAQVSGSDGESAFLIDVLAEYGWSRYFVDFGVGGWITDGDNDNPLEDDQVDLIVGLGARIFGEPHGFNTSLFLEIRSAFDELDDMGDSGRFGFGVRFRF